MNQILYIREHVSRADLWGQLAEEALEVAHAALKLQRLCNGTNPPRLTESECYAKLAEERADLELVSEVLGLVPASEFENYRAYKVERWVTGIAAKEAGK